VPLIITLSTVKVVNVPNEVIFDCAAPVTVAAVPDTFPVTSPVKGPAKASAVTVPSKNASLNSKLDVPKSISLSVTGAKAPSTNLIWSAPAALNIILLSVAKSISLSASLPITKLVFVNDDIVVWEDPKAKSNVLSPSSNVTEYLFQY